MDLVLVWAGKDLTLLCFCLLYTSFTQLVVYRIIGGVGIGVVSIVSPLYISEVAVAQYRGRLVSLYQLAVTVGFLGAYLINYQLLAYAESGNQLSMDLSLIHI